MRRREFLALLSSAAAWPLAARAQQAAPALIGVLNGGSAAAAAQDLGAFRAAIQQLGYIEGRNILFEYRFADGNLDRLQELASELVRLNPRIIVSAPLPAHLAARTATTTIPIVMANGADPVGFGLVESLAHPGGNTTGFSLSEYGISVKWLELLKQIAPSMTRAAVLQGSGATPGIGQLAAMQAVAPSFGVELTPLVVGDAGQIERALTAFAREPNGGLIITTTTLLQLNRDLIIALAARHRIPAVYPFRVYVSGGGLISYGPDLNDQFRRAAGYVDRVLKGEKPADLPVQAPTKYELVINLKTAKALGLTVPPSLLARADEVIE